MAGSHFKITVEDYLARGMLRRMAQIDSSGMLANIGERMVESTERRFREERGPDGAKWQALKPSYQRGKRYNQDKVLTLRGYLSGRVPGQGPHWQPQGQHAVEWGVSAKYGAIHQFGGAISRRQKMRPSRYNSVTGQVLGRMRRGVASRSSSKPLQPIRIPARPFLGISAADEQEIREIILDWVATQAK